MKTTLFTTCLALALTACGGSSGENTSPGQDGLLLDLPFDVQVNLESLPDWDGTASELGEPFKAHGWSAYAGDHENTGRKQAYFSFPIGGIPEGATIKKATLWLYQEAPLGAPYQSYGDVVLDHMWYDPPFDDLLDKPAMAAAFSTLSQTPTEGFRQIDVTARFLVDYDGGHEHFQVRVRHVVAVLDGNGQDDYTQWASADSPSPEHRPMLVVLYDE